LFTAGGREVLLAHLGEKVKWKRQQENKEKVNDAEG